MTLITTKASSKLLEVVQTAATIPARSFTVYFVRHGEALHNVEEKRAKTEALRTCCERGLSAEDKETVRAMDKARKDVLRDPAFFDATITEQGRHEARCARANIMKFAEEGLPAPREVITSPLQRCLATVEELFPDNNVEVRVEEDLRERLTGRPADNRYCSDILEKRYPRFDFGRLRSLSQSNLLEACHSSAETDVSDSCSSSGLSDDYSAEARLMSSEISNAMPLPVPFGHAGQLRGTASTLNADVELEDDGAVRKRAFHLFKMLEESSSDSVAVVTHKGFLRALERGCFGISGSPEFKNCEVRVYRIEMTPGNQFLDRIERLR
ncbi:hypothetical protein ACA910_014011 [Epithemia clementina (nom. ined.)]